MNLLDVFCLNNILENCTQQETIESVKKMLALHYDTKKETQAEDIYQNGNQNAIVTLSLDQYIPPIIIVAGGCKDTDKATKIDHLFAQGLITSKKRIYISGATKAGICYAVALARKESPNTFLFGFSPKKNEDNTVSKYNVPLAPYYDDYYFTDGDDFSIKEVEAYWQCVKSLRKDFTKVLLIGAGGGELSYKEYEIALDKGANVLLIKNSGRAADEFLAKNEHPNLQFVNIEVSPEVLQGKMEEILC